MISFKEYIEKIKEKSYEETKIIGNREVYITKNQDIAVSFWRDKEEYLNGLQYIIPEKRFNKQHWYKELWIWSNPMDFYNNYLDDRDLKFKLYSHRFYGQPKLIRPKELKGVKKAFSVDYIPKRCKCQCFILGDDIWVKHGDYFSSEMKVEDEDFGMPLETIANKYVGRPKGNKFVYPDCWGSIILRDEAWVVIENLIHRIKLGEDLISLNYQICRQQERYHNFKQNELEDTGMMRFWDGVISKTKKYISELNGE